MRCLWRYLVLPKKEVQEICRYRWEKNEKGTYFNFGCCLVTKLCPNLLWHHGLQGPLSMGFPRQGYWNGLPSFSRRSSRPRDRTHINSTGRGVLYDWATKESPYFYFTVKTNSSKMHNHILKIIKQELSYSNSTFNSICDLFWSGFTYIRTFLSTAR